MTLPGSIHKPIEECPIADQACVVITRDKVGGLMVQTFGTGQSLEYANILEDLFQEFLKLESQGQANRN